MADEVSTSGAETDAIHRLVCHVVSCRYEDLPASAVEATKTFILDSLGVAIVGTLAPGVAEALQVLKSWGGKEESTVLFFSDQLPAPSTAMMNSFLIHNQEFDCVNDRAVVHPFTTALPVALSVAEAGGNVSGRELLTAVALGIDVSCSIGIAARAPMTHFRPGTAGAFGAVAAAGKILGFGETTLANAMGIVYSQICGTLQSHHEGAVVNSMQTGFNARGAVTAVALAAAGVEGPREVLEGRYGYFRLFEGEYQLDDADLGRVWQVERVSHKPYPCGRLTHGAAEAALTLRNRHGIRPADVAEVEAILPPLAHRLVGRGLETDTPTSQYAKLCVPFVVATALVKGDLFVSDFRGEALRDPAVHDLARRIRTVGDDAISDENAMAPVRLRIRLKSGDVYESYIERLLGHPDKPLTREQHLGKFRRCWEAGAQPLAPAIGQRLIDLIDNLEDVTKVEEIVRLLTPATPG